MTNVLLGVALAIVLYFAILYCLALIKRARLKKISKDNKDDSTVINKEYGFTKKEEDEE